MSSRLPARTLPLLILIIGGSSCAHAGRSQPAPAPALCPSDAAEPGCREPAAPARPPPASRPVAAQGPTSRPALPPTADRLRELRRLIEAQLTSPELARARLSLMVVPLRPDAPAGPASAPARSSSPVPASQPAAAAPEPLISVEVDARRVPASNAKLLTTLAAAVLLPGKYRFVTEVSRRGSSGTLCLWGSGDPILRTADLQRLAKSVRAQGVSEVSGIIVDDSHFGRERLAPGFADFAEGSHYRPTSGALNVDGNAIEIRVSAPAERKRPRIDVTPPSDYVVVRKLVRYGKARGPQASESKIQISVEPRASSVRVTVSGVMGRKARPFFTRRAVPDPSLNAGWALRRALVQAGVRVSGTVRRGRRAAPARVLARREHALAEVLRAANQHSDNLAAETLVRVMSFLPEPPVPGAPISSEPLASVAPVATSPGSWTRGMQLLRRALTGLGLSAFEIGNGSGLHRRAWVTARTLTDLLRAIHASPSLRKLLVPTLAVAGKSGTLAPRLRGTGAEGHLLAKTGTLGGALALSGFVDPAGRQPLAFSLIVNGRSDRPVRERMDRIAELVARYARGLELEEAASAPAGEQAPPEQQGEPAEGAPATERAEPPAGEAS